MNQISIIMYHYVRNLKDSRYPHIKGLDLQLFRQQIEFLKNNFNLISCDELLSATRNEIELPNNSILLTFDDGYMDHYTNVYPILLENKIQSFFSMPGKILEEKKILDVNKIHFILASTNEEELFKEVLIQLDFYRGKEFDIPSNKKLIEKLAVSSRFDNKEVIFIKRLLQVELPERLRSLITDNLFGKFIGINEDDFCNELYMNHKQIRDMKDNGMVFGIHGYDHNWMNQMNPEELEVDITKALDCFSDIIDKNNWIMCYPYGSYSDAVIDIAKKLGCKCGLSTDVKVADLKSDNIMSLPRLDTNDFPPKSSNYINFYNYIQSSDSNK